MPESFASRHVFLKDPEKASDIVVLEVMRLLDDLVRRGKDISAGDVRIRKYYDAAYLTDALLISWDKR